MEINQVTSLFLAILVLLIGSYLAKKFSILEHYSIPSPVIGGLLFYFLIFILHSFDLITISVDTSLQSLFMLVFFTTVGLGASFKLIKLGGKLLIIYLLAASFLSLVQNTLGVSIATLLGITRARLGTRYRHLSGGSRPFVQGNIPLHGGKSPGRARLATDTSGLSRSNAYRAVPRRDQILSRHSLDARCERCHSVIESAMEPTRRAARVPPGSLPQRV